MATVDNRFTAVLGPIKQEILNLSAVNDADTVESRLQRPLFAVAVNTTDTDAITVAVGVSISGKTLTLNSVDFGGTETAVVLVFGF